MRNKTAISVVFFALMMVVMAFSPAADVVYRVDTEKSAIHWTGQNIAGGKHTGTISLSQGALNYDNNRLTGGSFIVDVSSIKVTDLTGDRAKRLENHLKSEDFFDAPKFPAATFKITKVAGNGTALTISGDLTIKGITKSVTFPATVRQSGNVVQASANGVRINRTEFDIKYRSGSFFAGLGDRAIEDEFVLDIELVAVK